MSHSYFHFICCILHCIILHAQYLLLPVLCESSTLSGLIKDPMRSIQGMQETVVATATPVYDYSNDHRLELARSQAKIPKRLKKSTFFLVE